MSPNLRAASKRDWYADATKLKSLNLKRMDSTDISAKTPGKSAFLISFSGIDGSGKSTQVERLCAQLTEAGIPILQLAFWDHVVVFRSLRAGFSHKYLQSERGVGAPGKPVNRNDKNKRGWYLTLPRTCLYLVDALMLRRAVARARSEHAGAIIFDRYIFDQLATLPLDRPLARAYARLILSLVPEPDIAYVLDADPEIARARKPEYPLEFMRHYRRAYLSLCDLANMCLIKPQSADDTQAAISRRLSDAVGIASPSAVTAPI